MCAPCSACSAVCCCCLPRTGCCSGHTQSRHSARTHKHIGKQESTRQHNERAVAGMHVESSARVLCHLALTSVFGLSGLRLLESPRVDFCEGRSAFSNESMRGLKLAHDSGRLNNDTIQTPQGLKQCLVDGSCCKCSWTIFTLFYSAFVSALVSFGNCRAPLVLLFRNGAKTRACSCPQWPRSQHNADSYGLKTVFCSCCVRLVSFALLHHVQWQVC